MSDLFQCLFRKGVFTGAGGGKLTWKIDCDALNDLDIHCIAELATQAIEPFGMALGVPRGGWRLAEAFNALRNGRSTTSTILVVDDVWTTGKSWRSLADECTRDGFHVVGFVIFSRGQLSPNVKCFMQVPEYIAT